MDHSVVHQKVLNRFLFWISSLLLIFGCAKPQSSLSNSEPEAPESSVGIEKTDVLIYSGPGIWRNEIDSLKKILYSKGASYQSISPQDLNRMSEADFEKFRAILFAGGDAPTVRGQLSMETRERIRKAVQKQGLNYLGFCAGAYLAVAPEPAPGADVVYGIGVVDGEILKGSFLLDRGLSYSLDRALFPNGESRNLLWYGGPSTPDSPWGVVLKYSNGTPAISQIRSGQGLVLISGFHPAANKEILKNLGINESEAIAPDLAWLLLESVIKNKPLTVF